MERNKKCDIQISRDVEVRESTIDGMGVFALRDFEAGEIVLHWDVSIIIATEELDQLPESERKYTHIFDENKIMIVRPPERFVNHSCNNNTEVQDFCDIALRHIAPGEEITSDYSSDGSESNFICSCKAENCRGGIGNFSPKIGL
jgi:SET domain-containing protein